MAIARADQNRPAGGDARRAKRSAWARCGWCSRSCRRRPRRAATTSSPCCAASASAAWRPRSAYREAGREDLAGGEEAEGELIGGYLPAELSDEELRAIVAQARADSGAESAKDMGAAMKQAMAAVDGRADGKRVSGLVRAALQA